MIKAKIEKVSISSIKENAANPRTINKHKFKKLVNSVKEFPEMLSLRPIIVDKDNVILGGNMRYKACKELGIKEVYIIQAADLDDKQAQEFIVKDNVGFGEWDWDILANDWDVKELEEWGLDGFPFEEEVLEAEEDDYTEPDNMQVDVILGDLFEIGEHRLLCGDSTCSDTVSKLMDGEKADMVFTDPPYGIEYKSNWKNKNREKFDTLKNDNSILDFRPVLDMFCSEICPIYIWTSHQVFHIWREMYSDIYKSTIIWYKKFGGMGDLKAEYGHNYEMCLYLTKNRIEFISERPKAVWEIASDNPSKYKHPTQKPIELALKAFTHHKAKNILDLFLGSGSTMVAAHQLNRKCYGMELDPKYCQVIIDRMLKLDDTLIIKRNGKQYNSNNS